MRVKQSIHDAFDTVSCDEVLKGRTCEYVIKHMHRSRKPAPRRMKWAVSLACLLLFATSGLGGYSLYYTEAAVISIDVNPSIELDINRWGKVVALMQCHGVKAEYASVDSHMCEEAHEHGMSLGKYYAIQELLTADPQATLDEFKDKSMKEIKVHTEHCEHRAFPQSDGQSGNRLSRQPASQPPELDFPYIFSRNACHSRVVRHIPDHDGSRSHSGLRSNPDSIYDGAANSQKSFPSHNRMTCHGDLGTDIHKILHHTVVLNICLSIYDAACSYGCIGVYDGVRVYGAAFCYPG